MKPIPLILLTCIAAIAPVRAQDEPVALPAAARILGRIPDGNPPPPAPPKRKLVIRAEDVLETTVHHQGTRTVTMREIKPLPLPPAPAPVPERNPAAEADFRRLAAEYRNTHPGTGMLFLSATVFRSHNSPPRTLVRWWPQNGRQSFTFWSSADFSLIAGGINSFVDSDGETHSIFMSWGPADIDRMVNLQIAKGFRFPVPQIPAFPPGAAAFQFADTQPDAGGLIAIQSLHDLYNSNLAELTAAFQGREQARAEREAYLKAHPPQPENITLNWWRTEEPAAQGGRP